MIEIIESKPKTYIKHCEICKESYEINMKELLNTVFDTNICPRCKQAILYARRMMENQGD